MLDFFNIQQTLVHISIGSGYDMSYIEAIGTIFGLLCIWYASQEKTINYPFGLVNVTLFCIIFYQIQLYANLLLQIFFFGANGYGWYAWSKTTKSHEQKLKIHWLSKPKLISITIISILAILFLSININAFFALLTNIVIYCFKIIGLNLPNPSLKPDAYPILDSAVTILSIVAMLLMTRKYVENWLIWIAIDVLSIILYAKQSVYAMSLEYVILLLIAINGARLWVKQAQPIKY